VTVAEAAYAWQAQGVCTIPILPNKTKRPVVRWKEYQARLPANWEMSEWWGNGHEYGLALIMGKVSGNLEMLELEAAACDGASITEIVNRCDELGVGFIWDLLNGPDGYTEMSPSGGLHFIYKVEGAVVPGNEKVASGPDAKVLSETRGEGGYVIVAPTSGLCHPSGESWVLVNGEAGQIPTITWEQRCLVHLAIRQALHYTEPATELGSSVALSSAPPAEPVRSLPADVRGGAELRPGDDFDARVSWDQILMPMGWQRGIQETDGTIYWTRPGKDPRDGYSATTGHAADRNRLWVFSTSTVFPAEESITKFRAYSILRFNGDDSACASFLASQNYGTKTVAIPDDAGLQWDNPIEADEIIDLTDQGNAERLLGLVGPQYRWSQSEKSWRHFNGQRWVRDESRLYQDAVKMFKKMTRSTDPQEAKWGKRCQSDAAVEACRRSFRHQPGISVETEQFNQRRDLLNLNNGTLNLSTGELLDHNPQHYITQMFNASHDPQATCPNFDEFIVSVLPDPQIRAYVQRAVGATLLGEAGARAVFLAHGPSGTGKTQFLELLKFLFGTYGATAPASTFRSKRDNAPPHDLHKLAGKRFVATSETSDTASFDEELLKRLTGGDSISSRDLYESFQDWVPECDIWMATNFPPRFSSDDNAMWKRAKLIPFMTVMGEDGNPNPIPNFARTRLFDEADGILNWILAGLRDFLEGGLQEPESIGLAADQLRLESDPVGQFAEESFSDGVLELGEDKKMRSAELHNIYQEWSRRNGQRAVSQRRFVHRLESTYPQLTRTKSDGAMWFFGVQRAQGSSILGNFWLANPD
jgi:putative DNA primase/helicase